MKKFTATFGRSPLFIAIAAATQLLTGVQVYAGPEGGQVVGGAGTISQAGRNTTINQHTERMAIDWQSFNVGADERVQFIQPGSTSVALNRILSHSGSEIHGRIDANGHVILVNPNGVLFGEGSQINVGGIIASGLQIDPNDFMNGDFTLTSMEGAEGKVINSGIINAATGGSVTLVGNHVENDGLISAKLGTVNLLAGKEAVVTFDSRGLMGIKVSKAILQEELGIDAAVINSGEINAEGGRILLSGATSQDIFSQAVNQGDLAQANGVVIHGDGSFTLGAGADVVNTGTLSVSSVDGSAGKIIVIGENVTSSGVISADSVEANAGSVELHARLTALVAESSVTSAIAEKNAMGGQIKVLGHHVGVFDQSRIDASGAKGGGEVLIGGDFQGKNTSIRNAYRTYVAEDASIYADALVDGGGGRIIIWADDITRYYGNIFARGTTKGAGGFAEISGKNHLSFNGFADLLGGTGKGTLLLDPENITIVNFGGSSNLDHGFFDYTEEDDVDINASAIVSALSGADVILQATNNIIVGSEISANSDNENSLTLQAGNSIAVNADIKLGGGDLNFIAGDNDCGGLGCAESTNRRFVLDNEKVINTTGNVSIKSADNIEINGTIGSNLTNSVNIEAGNNITLASTSSITAGKNTSSNSPTIFLSAGTTPVGIAPRTVSLTGNIELLGTLTTDGGVIELAATGLASNTTGTGVVNVKNNIATRGGDFIVKNTGDFSNNFISNVNPLDENSPNGLNNFVDIINTSSADRSGGGDISIRSGGNVTLGTVRFGYNTGGSGPLVRIGSLTVEAGKDFTLAQILNFNDTGTRNGSGVRDPSLSPNEHDPFFKVAAGGNITINEGAKILDYWYGDARDSLNIYLHAGSSFNGDGEFVYNQLATGRVDIDANIYTAGGNFSASGRIFDSSGVIINTDRANESAVDNIVFGQERGIATASLGGNVSISADSLINLGSITTDSNCPATTNCTGDLIISRRGFSLPAVSMAVTQDTGALTVNGRTTIDVGNSGDVTFADEDNRFTGGFVLQSARNVSIVDAEGDIMVNGVNVNNLTLRAINGNILQASGSAITVAGSANLTAQGENSSIVLNERTGSGDTSVSRNNFGGVVSASTTGGAITLGDVDSFILGEISSNGGNITLNTDLTLNNNRTINAVNGGSRGDVVITGAINSGSTRELTINADDITFGSNIGASGRLGAIRLYASGDVNAASNAINAVSLTANNLTSFTAGNINTSSALGNGGDINITGTGTIILGSLNAHGTGITDWNGYNGGSINLSGNTIRVFDINTSGSNAGIRPGDPGIPPREPDPLIPGDTGFPGEPGTPDQPGLRGLGGAVTITGNGDNPTITLRGDINTRHGSGRISGAPSGDELTQGLANVTLSQAGSILLNHNNFFTSNVTLNGNGQNHILRGFNHGGTWTTTAANTGRINGTAGLGVVTFNNFENLDGGSGNDTFNLNHNVTGRVRGGDGNDIFNIRVSIDGNINGQGGDDEFFIDNINDDITANINGGQGGTDTIRGANRVNNWEITGGSAGRLNNNVTFSGIEYVMGGALQDIFRGVDNLSGNGLIVDGGAGTDDTVIVNNDFTLNLTGDIDQIFRGVRNVNIIHSDNGGTLTVNSSVGSNVLWSIRNTGNFTNNSGGISSDGSDITSFTNFSNLIGGDGNDIFFFSGASEITGTIDGRDGINQVNVSGTGSKAHVIELSNVVNNDATLHVRNIDRITGNSNQNAWLVASSGNNTWNIASFDAPNGTDGVNDGFITSTDLGRVEFVNFNNLRGGSGLDHFNFAVENSGSITGRVDGGGGSNNRITGRDVTNTWTIDSNSNVSIAQGALNYLNSSANIQRLQGGSEADIFYINADFDGNIYGGIGGDHFIFGGNGSANLVDGQDGDDTLWGRNAANTWNINNRTVAADGNTYVDNFLNMEILQGGGQNDTFEINAVFAGTIRGGAGDDTFRIINNGRAALIDGQSHSNGDVLDLTNAGNGLSVAFGADIPADVNFVNIEEVNANTTGNHRLIAGNTVNIWNITAENGGTLQSPLSTLRFTGFANLMGGTSIDEFIFANNTATITGVIDGGAGVAVDVLDLTSRGRDSQVRVLQSASDATSNTINILNIEEVVANTAHNNTLLGANLENAWHITGLNTGTLNRNDADAGLAFSNFQNLTGGARDDTFRFVGSGDITGVVDGGAHLNADSVDKSLAADGDVRLADVNGSGFINIERYIGNNLNSTLYGDNANNIWTLGAGENVVTITTPSSSTLNFVGFVNLEGGSGEDTFNISQGLLTGSIRGGNGVDRFNVNGGRVGGQLFGGDGDDIFTVTVAAGSTGSLDLIGGNGSDQLVVNGGNADYTALHNYVGGASEYTYTDAAGNTFTLGYEQVERVNDNLQAASLMVNGTAAADIFSLYNNRYRLNGLGDINYANKSSLIISASDNDVVNVEGRVELLRDFVVRNAQVNANPSGLVVANHLRLDGTANVGSVDNRLTVNVNSLAVSAANGAIYLQEQNSLDITELSSNNLVNLRLGGNLTSSTPLIFSRDFIAATTGGDILLRGQNELTGNLSLSSTGLVELNNNSITHLNEIRAQNLNVNSFGVIHGNGSIVVNGLAQFSTNSNLFLNHVDNNFNSVTVTSANNVELRDSNALVLTGLNITGKADVSALDLSVNGIVEAGAVTFNATNTVLLGNSLTTQSDIVVNAGGQVNQQGNVQSNAGNILLNTGGFVMNSGTRLTTPAGSVTINAGGDVLTRTINASRDINVNTTGGLQISDALASSNGMIQLVSGNDLVLSGSLDGGAGIDLQSVTGNIQQNSQLQSQSGDISLVAARDITMGTNAVVRSIAGDVNYTGANIAMTSFFAEAGTVSLKATTGAISDVNGGAINVTANRFEADAQTGIGSGDGIETQVAELSLSNNLGIINIENNRAVTVNRLHNNGNVTLNNLDGDITLDNTSGTLYSLGETDARLAGGTVNANYDIGSLTINVANGNLLATNAPNIQNPDIVARTAILTTPGGSLGSPERMLVVYVKDYLFIGGMRSWGPFWGFNTRPADVDNQATIQGNLSDLLASGNEQLVEVETLDEVDPAVFTSVRNYFYDDIAIMLPRDQHYYDDEDDQ